MTAQARNDVNAWVPDLTHRQHIHIIAIGGAAMSALARILLAEGHRVTGSDLVAGAELSGLRLAGAEVWVGHDPAHVDGADLVAISTAVREGNPELEEAFRRRIPVAGRPAMMEAIIGDKRTVAISGTHGKTTTSAMAAVAFDAAGLSPSFFVGAQIAQLGAAVRWGPGPLFVAEADESDSSFLRFRAEAVIVTNMEEDHLDFHGSMENLEAAFAAFVDGADRARVLCADDAGSRRLASRHRDCITYGTSPDAVYRIVGFEPTGLGSSFTVEHAGGTFPMRLQIGGLHNARNATAVLAMGCALGTDGRALVDGLADFRGVARRFEFRGERNGITFVDDYGHLPAKVAATLAGARGIATSAGWKRIVAVFEPHRYTRVQSLGLQFADAFADADVVVVTPIYAAGQDPIPGVTSRLISGAIRVRHPDAVVVDVDDRQQTVAYLVRELRPGDLCITLNAGDLTTLPDDVQRALGGS